MTAVNDGREDEIDRQSTSDSAFANSAPPTGPATGPVLLWLLIQLAALVPAALRVPLAAKYPEPAELLATHLMLATQVAVASLLFPYLMRDWRTATAVIAAAWPFVALASVLSATPFMTTASAEAYVTLWLVALALWSAALPGPRSKLYGVAVAAALAVGGAALWYLAREFNPATEGIVGGNGERLFIASPLVSALRQLTAQSMHWTEKLIPIVAASAALSVLVARRLRARANLSTARAPGGETARPISS